MGPWSGLSMHPVEHFIYLTSICVHWIVLSHPAHLIFHILYQGPGAAMNHTGYEDLLVKDKRKLALGTFYHHCITVILNVIMATKKCHGIAGSGHSMMAQKRPHQKPARRKKKMALLRFVE